MAGGKAGFLNELDGDLVIYLRTAPLISDMVETGQDARIYAEQARQGQPSPYIVYTQAAGHSEKHLAGLDGCENITLHIYAYGSSPNISHALARAIHDRLVPTSAIIGDGTKLHVCNGGIVDTGVVPARDGSDRKEFWTRLVLKMVISD